MQKVAVLFAALVLCVAVIDARPRDRYRYRPSARYQQVPRYNPRYAQYNRYRPSRLVAEGEEVPEYDVPVTVLGEELPTADFPEVASFPVEVPAVQEPLPVDDVPLSASPDESYDHETRLLPEPEYRAAASSGTYFPLRFDGGVNGGAVAVANSYSTGKSGKSESRAVAFGNPDAARYYSRRH